MNKIKIGLLSVAMLFVASHVFAQKNEKKDTVRVSESIQTIKLASDLAVYGYKNNSVSALIQAADLFLSIATVELKTEKIEQGGEGEKTPAKETVSFDVAKILSTAKELATLEDDEATYLALITKLEKKSKDKSRSPIGGTQYATGYLYGGYFTEYYVRFYPYQRADIDINGSTSDIDLYVYDSYGNLIVSNTNSYYNPGVYFTPNCDCIYTIKVWNRGGYATSYSITAY